VGVLSGTSVSPAAPFFIAISLSVASVIFLWMLKIKTNHPTQRSFPSPWGFLKRYLAQPRLRLAYILALGRAAWWQMFFVYCPIALLELGYSAKLAGLIGSIALAMTVFIPIWAAIARRIGVRRLVMFGFGITGLSLLNVAAFHDNAVLVLTFLILATFWATSLDGVGNIFFLRAVHPYERVEMASVFSTFRDAAQAVPSVMVVPLARFFEMSLILGLWGFLLLGLAGLASRLPRRL
jgi:hypothetical protein